MSHSTQHRSFQRRSSQPVSWLGTEERLACETCTTISNFHMQIYLVQEQNQVVLRNGEEAAAWRLRRCRCVVSVRLSLLFSVSRSALGSCLLPNVTH